MNYYSADQLDFKEIVYQFADTVEGVAEGVVSVAKAIPVVVEAIANFPQVLSEIQKDATRKIEELKDAVVDTKSAINGEFHSFCLEKYVYFYTCILILYSLSYMETIGRSKILSRNDTRKHRRDC